MYKASLFYQSNKYFKISGKWKNDESENCLVYAITGAINDYCIDKDVVVDYCWLLETVKLKVAKKIPGGLNDLSSPGKQNAKQGSFSIELENSIEDNKAYLLQINIKNKNIVSFPDDGDFNPCNYIRCSCLKREDNSLKNNMCLVTILKNQHRGKKYFLFTNEDKLFLKIPMNLNLWSSFKQYRIRMEMKPLELDSTSESN